MTFFDLPLPELEQYLPEVPEPEDLDEFWSATLAQARSRSRPPTATTLSTRLRLVQVQDVTFTGWGGHPVRAWCTRPAGSEGDDLPAVVQYLGYGGGRGLPGQLLTWAAAGYVHLLMDTRGQGSTWGSGGHTSDPVGSAPAGSGVMTRGVADPAGYYFTRLVTDAVRAVDTVQELPGVDADRVAVCGASQGGGLALATAGLVPDLRAVMADVPFLCHVRHAVGLTDADPYGEVRRYLAVHRGTEEQVFRTLSYVDGVNLGRRATAPALFSVALQDTTCPPSAVYAAYNHYGTRGPGPRPDRRMEVYPYNGHEGGEAYQERVQLDWFAGLV